MRFLIISSIFFSVAASAGFSLVKIGAHEKAILHQNKRLQQALEQGNEVGVEKALRKGADPNIKNEHSEFMLYSAVNLNLIKIVKILLQNEKTNKNALNHNTAGSALHLACELGLVEIVQMFINAKADPILSLPDGSTPLHKAAQAGHSHVVKKLIHAKVALDAQMNDDATPIFLAAQNGHSEAVILLLNAKADAGITNEEGFTPLHIAAANGHLSVVMAIVKNGADVAQTCRRGLTPFELAKKNKRSSVAMALKRHIEMQGSATSVFEEGEEKDQF